jgi:hypothetical protein
MSVANLISHIRFQTDDIIAPYLFPDADIEFYLKEAEIEACRRQPLLIGTHEFNVYYGDYKIELPNNLRQIRRVKVNSQSTALYATKIRELYIYNTGWENQTPSEPRYFFTDQKTLNLSVYPKFSKDDILQITASRLPVFLLEIQERYHIQLCDWVLYRLYSKKDSKIYDSIKSENFLAAFIGSFGNRVSAENENMMQKGASYAYEYGQVSKPQIPQQAMK